MDKATALKIGIDVLKLVGDIVKDTVDIGDYRITVLLERKIDERTGIVIENISVDKKMNRVQAESLIKDIKQTINKQ